MALFAGLCLRVSMMAFVDIRLVNDAATYELLARNLLEHGIFSTDGATPFRPSMYRPPLYPGLLALVFAVAGHSLLAVQVVQIALSLLTVWIVSRCASQWHPGIGRSVLWLMALSPFDAVYSVAFLSEGLTSFFISTGFAAWSDLRTRWRWVFLGAALGLATLCRDIYIALPPFLALAWLLFGDGTKSRRLKAGAVLVATTLLVVSTWSIRNAVVMEKWAPVTAGRLGISLWIGSWTVDFRDVGERDGRKIYPRHAYLDDAERQEHARLSQLADVDALDRFYMRAFVRRVQHEPAKVLGRWIARVPLLWLGTRFDIFELNPRLFPSGSPQWNLVKAGLFALNAALTVLGICGIVLAWRRRSALRWWSVPILFTAAVYMPMNSYENRYSQPVYALLLVFSAMGARQLTEFFRARRRGRTGNDLDSRPVAL